ncbi:hypothetical protein PENANT_c020G06001 [Penicillium antarcticum]|uniref:Uncharacterized protein n=1 Tax=Penicillium antarcticum TaxID=416450 RepID=A0A1V6Q1B6_9EURO|nr:uncharacterized protein N7508_004318 [Penicillium antarcticum]KAJ5308939.1 hypothetical protein N7508_004318 [Penicillium antarcticum]OQD82662.1 hypothetical protein PENANT_c020G06001 [Penicillium antarcticum]
MAGIVNGPLSLFRKSDSTKPLHARWGDVAISVPTDGSWNQYDNPHRPVTERQPYGPGYVPDCSPQDRNPRPVRDDDPEDDAHSVSSLASTVSRRNSLSLGALRPGRLSARLSSRPKHLRGETASERAAQREEQKRAEFAYRPIQQDYTSEVVEKSSSNRFKYIPTNGRYLEGSSSRSGAPRSQSVSSYRTSYSRRESLAESIDEGDDGYERERFQSQTPMARGSAYIEDDRRSLRSSLGDSSDSSSGRRNIGLPPRRNTSPFVAADRRRASSAKPMTLAMVPDPDELYE